MMEKTIKKSYYAIIPAFVRYDEDLAPNAKLLYGEITALCNDKGYCWATNEYFSSLYKVSVTSVSKWISSLVKKGYIISEIDKSCREKRGLRIPYVGLEEKLNPPLTKVNQHIEEKLKDNNTSIINKENIKESDCETDTYSADDLEHWFETTYAIYPRKFAKVKAKEFYERKLRGLTREDAKNKANFIYVLVKKHINVWGEENDYEGRQKEHIPYFSTWLNANVEDSPNYKRGKRK